MTAGPHRRPRPARGGQPTRGRGGGRGPGGDRRPRLGDPRRVAYDVLRAVGARDAYANLVLPGLLAERGVTGRDAALATELVYGSLRGRGLLDAVLARCVDRPLDAVDEGILDALRLGAHQLLATRIPPHAAVSATVDVARATAGEGPARFVNAVLRRVAERDTEAWTALVAPAFADDPIGHLEVVTSHPGWIVTALRDALGGDLAETRLALDADNARPRVHLAARPGRITRAELLDELGPAAQEGQFSPYAVRLEAGDPGELAAVRSGAAGVQDEGSQLAALALAAAPLEPAGGAGAIAERAWLDLCAGPGGKSALLAGLAGQRGAGLLAVEVAAHRARLVARTLAGAGGRTLVVQADGRSPLAMAGSFDRVLVDAPCSGLGALRRRPEARWRRSPADLPGLGQLQRALLRRAVDLTRPGGVVAYVTCSPHVAETRVVVDDLRRALPGLVPMDTPAVLAGFGVADAAVAGSAGYAQLWPHRHGTDAMFVALLRVTAQAH